MAKRSAWTDISHVPESTAASAQRQPNKYDGSQDMAKRSAWTGISDAPESIAASTQRQPNKWLFTGTWLSVLHELTYLLS
jgi:hypothetical protein